MGRSGHITSFAIDVTTLEPYKSCGQLANKAQGFALGSFAFQNDEESVITGLPRRFTPRNDEVLD